MAILGKEKYNPEKIEKLHEYVRTYAEKGHPIEYEIILDGFKAVRRTDDPEMFTMFENFVTPSTKNMEILFYIRNSNSNDKYMFSFKEDPNETLSGLEVENRVQEGISKAKKEWDNDQLRKEHQEQKEYIEELEEEVDKLEKEIVEIKAKQSPLTGVIGEFGASLVENLIKRNPKILQSLPGAKSLSGFMDTNTVKTEEGQDAEVSFQPKAALDEETAQAVRFVGYMKKSFPGEKFDKLMQIIDKLAEDTSKVETVLELLNEQ